METGGLQTFFQCKMVPNITQKVMTSVKIILHSRRDYLVKVTLLNLPLPYTSKVQKERKFFKKKVFSFKGKYNFKTSIKKRFLVPYKFC